MKKSTTILWFIASILMIAAGIVCFALPVDTTMTVFAYIVGALVLIMGIVELAAFFTSAGIVGGGAFLADGVITTLLGVVFLANESFALRVCNVVHRRGYKRTHFGNSSGTYQSALLVDASHSCNL